MKPCISEAVTLSRTFAEDVNGYADGGCRALEVWLTKLEKHLEKHSVADTRKLLEDREMTLAAASYQGGLLLSQGEQRKAHYDHFKRRLDLCQSFGISTLLIAADPPFIPIHPAANAAGSPNPAAHAAGSPNPAAHAAGSPNPAAHAAGSPNPAAYAAEWSIIQRAVVSLTQAAQWAAAFGVRLALEFRGSASFLSSLDTALALVAQCGESNVGVNFDVFHYYTGPSKFEDLALLSRDNLAFVQLSDVLGVPREWAGDGDRILPGEGDFSLKPILEHLRAIGYDGWVSLELFNPTLWQLKPAQVAELGLAALNRLLPS